MHTQVPVQNKKKQAWVDRHRCRGGVCSPTRLLLLILVTSCVISAAVVVFAVVFTFQHSDNAVINHIKRDSVLMRDGVSLFGYTRPGPGPADGLTPSSVQKCKAAWGKAWWGAVDPPLTLEEWEDAVVGPQGIPGAPPRHH